MQFNFFMDKEGVHRTCGWNVFRGHGEDQNGGRGIGPRFVDFTEAQGNYAGAKKMLDELAGVE